jgi:hypothetical protein
MHHRKIFGGAPECIATQTDNFYGAPLSHAPKKYGGPHPQSGRIIGFTIYVAHELTCVKELHLSVAHVALCATE